MTMDSRQPDNRAETQDASSRSLSDALRVSFALLKVVMIALLIAFVLSGSYYVGEAEVAVHMRFGRIVGEPGQHVLGSGLHFAWPEPIDQVVRISTSEQRVHTGDAFWFRLPEEGEGLTLDEAASKSLGDLRTGLDPREQGFLLTADRGIVHGRWQITWRVAHGRGGAYVDGPIDFLRTVGLKLEPAERMQRAEELVRRTAQQAIIQTVAETDTDAYVRREVNNDLIKQRIQASLDEIKSGLMIRNVNLLAVEPPLSLRPTFRQSTRAVQEGEQRVQGALRRREEVLLQTAGGAHTELLETIGRYEQARDGGNRDAAAQALAQINRLLVSQRTGGEVAAILSEAEAFRRGIVQRVGSDVRRFESLLPIYEQNPELVLRREWERTLQDVFSGKTEKIYLPPGNKDLTIKVHRDPKIQQEQQREQFQRGRGQ